jgi:hypothetical protein
MDTCVHHNSMCRRATAFRDEAECLETVCVTARWTDVDNAWEQEKLEARKLLENGDESHLFSARYVGQLLESTTEVGTY